MTNYDRDQEAIDWARAKIEKKRDFAREAEMKSKEAWLQARRDNRLYREIDQHHEQMLRWRRIANMLEMWFIGGEGCAIAAFDQRYPHILEMIDAQG